MGVKRRFQYMLRTILEPVKIVRLIDRDGTKKVIVLQRTPFKCKAVGKFEITQEFAAGSLFPHWEPVEFTTSNDFNKKTISRSRSPK